jgi:hypothetical protein
MEFDAETPWPIILLPTGMAQSLAEATGVELQPNLGFVVLDSLGCDNRPAAGISFEIIPPPSEGGPNIDADFYFNAGLPDAYVDQTDRTGIGGFINVPPNRFARVRATEAATGLEIGAYQVLVREGFMLQVPMIPQRVSE